MELFRQEYELNLPKNYGKMSFQRLQERELEKLLPQKEMSPNVREALDAQHKFNSSETEQNITKIMRQLSDDEICEYFANISTGCTALIMQSWQSVSDKVLRAISMTVGETLTELDLSYSAVGLFHLEILLARVVHLKVLRINGCVNFDPGCMSIVNRVSARHVTELYADDCPTFKIDTLLILGGCIGFHAPKLSHLVVLSLANCPIEDKGLGGVNACCRHLEFLNLCECSKLTDESVCTLIKQNKRLEVVNLTGCLKLSNAVVMALGKYCHNLQSLNISKLAKISDKAVVSLLLSCKELQALNLAGLRKLTENVLCVMAEHCQDVLCTLNITGCEKITTNGLDAIIEGFALVHPALAYVGFQPLDNYLELKLRNKLQGIKESNAATIQRFYKSRHNIWAVKEEYRFEVLMKAATMIQLNLRMYLKRLPFHYAAVARKRLMCCGFIQRFYRGYRGRLICLHLKAQQAVFLQLFQYALKMQRVFRGHICRRKNQYIATAIRQMIHNRLNEAVVSISVRFQSCGRRFLARKRAEAWREVRLRRTNDEFNSILIMQCAGRVYNACVKVRKMRAEKARIDDLIFRSATKIQKWFCLCNKRHRQFMSEDARRRIYAREWAATLILQKVYRGYRGKEKFNRRKIVWAREMWAAAQIQRIYRGCKILRWNDLRLNIISAYVLDRHYVERQDAIAASRNRYRMFLSEVKRDSASEPDQEQEEPPEWIENWDRIRQKKWWYNPITNVSTYDEPLGHEVHEKAMLFQRVRVYWVVQCKWYEGVLTDFHRRKRRHRVQYDDGDHEWINLEMEADRVQVQLEDGSWVMYAMFKPVETVAEINKVQKAAEEQKYKELAFRDAMQWKIVPADTNEYIMYLSEISGELRTGVLGADRWVVQDDGYGYPCFYDTNTGNIVHEDPRFEHDVALEQQQVRNYVLNELRFATYFIKDLWDKYEIAVASGNNSSINFALSKIRTSPKVKHMNAFLVRAKGLYERTSVVDIPMNEVIIEELEYCAWLAARIAEVTVDAEAAEAQNQHVKRTMVAKFRKGASEPIFCKYCNNETKRHLDYCATCGRKQLWL